MRLLKSFGLSTLTGMLWGFSTAYWNYDYFVFFALVPLLIAIKSSRSYFDCIVHGAWSITVGGVITLFWVPPALLAHAPQLGIFGAWLLFLCFNIFAHPQIYLMNILVRFSLEKKIFNVFSICLIAFVFSLADIVYPKLLNDTLAHSLFRRHGPLSYFAYPYGTYVLTFILTLVNLVLFNFTSQRNYKKIAAVLVVAFLMLLIPPLELKEPAQKGIEVVSVNTFHDFGSGAQSVQKRFEIYQELKKILQDMQEVSHARIVVFPESSYPFLLFDETSEPIKALNREFLGVIAQKKLHVFIGNVKLVDRGHHNVIVYMKPSQEMEFVPKRVLFPFGERIPLGDYLSFLNRFIPKPSIQAPTGSHQNFFSAHGRRIVPAICYESLFPAFIRGSKADLVLNISNEMVFGREGEPDLSFAQSVFNSLENRVPLIRASNSGMGGFIDRGRIVDEIRPTSTIIRRYWLE